MSDDRRQHLVEGGEIWMFGARVTISDIREIGIDSLGRMGIRFTATVNDPEEWLAKQWHRGVMGCGGNDLRYTWEINGVSNQGQEPKIHHVDVFDPTAEAVERDLSRDTRFNSLLERSES